MTDCRSEAAPRQSLSGLMMESEEGEDRTHDNYKADEMQRHAQSPHTAYRTCLRPLGSPSAKVFLVGQATRQPGISALVDEATHDNSAPSSSAARVRPATSLVIGRHHQLRAALEAGRRGVETGHRCTQDGVKIIGLPSPAKHFATAAVIPLRRRNSGHAFERY